MPNVNPSGSSPPESGNVEGPYQLQKLSSHQPVKETTAKHLPSSLSSSGLHSVDTCDHTAPLPQPGRLEQVASSTENVNISQAHGQERSRDEVVKDISISSAAFIGPACRPQPSIEDELSEFYKELKQIDHQDTADGDTRGNDGISQACAPAVNPPSGKETRRNDHRNAYRPYPPSNPHGGTQRDCWNAQRWRTPPQDGLHSYSWQNQWQPQPLRPPYGPQGFQFQGQFPPAPPGNPHPCLPQVNLPQVNHSNQVENLNSWERFQFPPGYNERAEQYKRNPSDWHKNEEQDHHEDQKQQGDGTSLVLILMRGLPGSGKSTLAKQMLSTGPSGLILSTDDYFCHKDGYVFDSTLLGDAHCWNQKRARKAMSEGRSPVIIDNTNVKAWEMKPYVAMALERGYRVEFVEPDTRWKCDPVELAKRNKHGVSRDTIAKMLQRFDFPISVDIVMKSSQPRHERKENRSLPHR